MNLKSFIYFSYLFVRYIQKDEELTNKLKGYAGLDICLKIKKTVLDIVIPRLNSLEATLHSIATHNKDKQVPRRVDGQHSGEISLNEVFRGYAKRLYTRTGDIRRLSLDFGQLAEAERNDGISDLVYFSISAFSVEANIANDIRHLFRSEIAEVEHKEFGEGRVGSSTMPHKRNPVEYEQIVSLWKAYMPRLISSVMGQITEHQGDSTNQDLPYFTFELLFAVGYATKSLENALKNLKINV
jgi:adenylosuccinate lyase